MKLYEQFEKFVQGSPEYTHQADRYYFKESGRFSSTLLTVPEYKFEKPGHISDWLQLHGTWRVDGQRETCDREIPWNIVKIIKTKRMC